MTIAGRSEARFGDITKVQRLGARFIAMAGRRNTIIVADNFNGLARVVEESPDLGAEARAVCWNFTGGSDVYYVLTDDGVQLTDATVDAAVLGAKVSFDPGDGRWIHNTWNDNTAVPYIVTPVDGGIQVLDQAGVRTSVSTPAGVGGCRDAVIGSDDVLYVVDDQRAKIHVWRIIGPKAIYIDSFRAKNCRDVVKVVLDETANILFVQCKHRIIGFNVTPAYSADSDISVTLRQDYGKLDAEFTDFVKIGTDQYWVGIDADSPFNVGTAFLGRTYADWDVGNNVLFAAFPDMSIFAAGDVIPYVGEVAIPPIPGLVDISVIVTPPPIVPPVIPPVIAPDPPVITSALTASVTEDTLFSYTITATGTGPIYYDVVGAPGWVTSINHTTGVVLGMLTDPGTFNITITATNAGGTDTETLVVTVTLQLDGFYDSGMGHGVLWYSNVVEHWQEPGMYFQYTHPAWPSVNFRVGILPEAGGTTAIGMRAVGPVTLSSGGYSTPNITQVTISIPGVYRIYVYADLELDARNSNFVLGAVTFTATIVGNAAFPSVVSQRRGEVRVRNTAIGYSPFANVPFGAIQAAFKMPAGSGAPYYTRLPSGSGGQTYTATSSMPGYTPEASGSLSPGQAEFGYIYYPSPNGAFATFMGLLR